jgi:hypothetical protein
MHRKYHAVQFLALSVIYNQNHKLVHIIQVRNIGG